MKSKYTRDVSHDMMKKLKENGSFAPFVDFVRKNENNDLALCFRGNDSEIGKVIIYRNNHKMWELIISKGKPIVVINPDHARFMKNWLEDVDGSDGIVKKLMNLGFEGPQGKKYDQLKLEKGFVKRSFSKKNNRYSYSAIELKYELKDDYEADKQVVEESYKILVKMQDEYFDPSNTEEFQVYYHQSQKYKPEMRPRNYIKQYFFESFPDKAKDDKNKNLYASFQECREKHVQQELFLNNHNFVDGLFIYDLEFEQPQMEEIEVNNSNKPDMFGIRFNSKGEMESICLIEVKSKFKALQQKKSGLESHLTGMEDYIRIHTKTGKIMDDRKREACRILEQYHELKLYDVDREFKNEEEFLKLDIEIIFVFSHDTRDMHRKIHKNQTINDVLKGYTHYYNMASGSYTGDITVMNKVYK